MRQLFFVLASDAADTGELHLALEARGLESAESALSPTGRCPRLPALAAVNRDLLRFFECDPAFGGRVDFATLPSSLEEALLGDLRDRWRELPDGPPIFHVSHEMTATLPFWLQAFPRTGAVLALHKSGRVSPGAGHSDCSPRLEGFLGNVARTPAYLLMLPEDGSIPAEQIERLVGWLREAKAVPSAPPTGLRRPWQIRLQPEPLSEAPVGWDGVEDERMVERLKATVAAPPTWAPSTDDTPALRFHWRRVMDQPGGWESGLDLERCIRRDLEEKEEQLNHMELELNRLKEVAARVTKHSRAILRAGETSADRLEGERLWRIRLQHSRVFRRAVRAFGLRQLLQKPGEGGPRDTSKPPADSRGNRVWMTGDPRRRGGLALLRAAAGRSPKFSEPTEEDLRFAPLSDEARSWIALNESLRARPRISVLLPVHAIDAATLRSALHSVMDQVYPEWELCVALDAAAGASAREEVETARAACGRRVRMVDVEGTPGIAASTNAAARLATGDYLLFLDHDDRLALDALLRFAERLQAQPDADLVYGDEDKIGVEGRREEAFHKPGWSPNLLLSFNYIAHAMMMRRQLFEEIGGLRPDFDGSQDFDLVLRASERARRIERIPLVLYHWRKHPGSTARDRAAKGGLWREASRRALADAVRRRGWKAEVANGLAVDTYRVHFEVDPSSRVTIVIPTCNHAAALARCVRSILKFTEHPSFEILIVSNNSSRPEMLELLGDLSARPRVRVLRHDQPFNFSALNNLAVSQTDAPYLLLLNDDTEVLHPGWMTALLEQASRPEIGAVGAQLVFPNRTIQHAGVVIESGFRPDHAFKHIEESEPGYYNFNRVVRDCSAVTAACLMVRREVYQEVGGMDESLAVAFNDVDFCLKVASAGYRNVYTPYARLVHYESLSRGSDRHGERFTRLNRELAIVSGRWKHDFDPDPFHNPNLEMFHPR